MQSLRVVGGIVLCQKCKERAAFYCRCSTFLCVLHLATHKCLMQLRMEYSEELLRALA